MPAAAGQEPRGGAGCIPREGLFAYVEWDGLDAHSEAWKRTATAKVLHETTTGQMLEELVAQLVAEVPARPDGPAITGAQARALVEHVVRKGVVMAVNGAPGNLAANGFFRLRFDGVFKAWYRVG